MKTYTQKSDALALVVGRVVLGFFFILMTGVVGMVSGIMIDRVDHTLSVNSKAEAEALAMASTKVSFKRFTAITVKPVITLEEVEYVAPDKEVVLSAVNVIAYKKGSGVLAIKLPKKVEAMLVASVDSIPKAKSLEDSALEEAISASVALTAGESVAVAPSELDIDAKASVDVQSEKEEFNPIDNMGKMMDWSTNVPQLITF